MCASECKYKGKTEHCIKFAVFKEKEKKSLLEPRWKQIEPHAPALGEIRLFCLVQGQDLFTREAQFHQLCRNSFNLRYINHIAKESNCELDPKTADSDEKRRAIAHNRAFTAVLNYVEKYVILKREVVELSTLRCIYVNELEKEGYPNPQYESRTLKALLDKHVIWESINFALANLGDKCYRL